MLEDIQKQFTFQQFKHFIFTRYSDLTLDTYPSINPTFGGLLFQTILQSILTVSILFQPGLEKYWVGEEILSLIDYSNYITRPDIYSSVLVDLITQAITIGILLLYILFFAIFMIGWLSKTLKIFFAHFTRFLRICCIPYFHVVVMNWYCSDCYNQHSITLPILTTIFAIFFICISITISFHFNFIPHQKNTLVRLDSNFYLYTYWINFIKVVVFQSRGFNLQYVGIAFFLDLAKLYYIRGYQQNKIIFLLRVPDLISLFTCVLILIAQFSPNFSFGTLNIWIIGIVIFIVALLLQWFIGFYKNNSQVYDCLHATDQQIILMTQQFMIKQWSTLESKQLFQYVTFICFHSNRCADVKCPLKIDQPKLKKFNLNNLQNYSSEIKSIFIRFILILLRKYSSSSPLVCTQYYIVCDHINQNLELLNIYPPSSMIQQYIRYSVKQRFKNQTQAQQLDINIDNFQESKSHLLSQFNKIIISLKQFMTELKVKKPDLDILMRHGYNSHKQIQDLKKLFMKILRSDFFDLRIIQIYMQFLVNILKEQECLEYISRISKNKWLTSSKNIQIMDSSIASLLVDPNEDKIFNMNAEAIKILKYSKMDIYDKKISSFLHPHNPQKPFRQLFDELIQKNRFCFIKDSMNNILPVLLSSKIKKQNQSKQSCILDIQYLGKLQEESFILINQNKEFIECHPQELLISKFDVIFDIRQEYEKCIFRRIGQLSDAKFINYQSQGYLIHAVLSQTIDSEYLYVKLSIKKRSDGFPTNQSIVQRHGVQQFVFHPYVKFQQNKPYLLMNGEFREVDSDSQGQQTIHLDIDELDTMAQELFLDYHVNYAEGIKSYGLSGDIIYNIQLEDTNEQKADSIIEEKFKAVKQQDHYLRNKKIKVYYFILVILALGYIITHIYVNVIKLDVIKKHLTDHPLQTITSFQTRFQRMFGVLRDAHLGVKYQTDTTWNIQIIRLFNEIQKYQKSLKFSKTTINFTLNNVTYNSFLDYACNIFITEMYRMALYNTTQQFSEINQKSMLYIDPAIDREKLQIYLALADQLLEYVIANIFTLGFHTVIVLVMLWLVLLINKYYRKNKETLMLPWRSMTDEEIQSIIDRLSIFQVQLILSQRNEEVEIYDSLKDTNIYKSRQYPKQFNQKNDKKNSYWIVFIVFVLVLGIVIHGYGMLVSNNQAEAIIKSIVLDFRVPSSYIQLVKASKYNAKINNETVINLNNIVNDIQRFLPDLNYNSEFKDELNQVFFGEHCQLMQNVVPNLTSCADFSIGFAYPNPLQMGYLIDVSALTFSMLNNITNLYLSTGIVGYVYEIGVIVFVKLLIDAKLSMVQKIYNNQVGYSMTNIILCFLILAIIILAYSTNISGIKKIQLISRLLNISLDKNKIKGNDQPVKKKGSYERLPSDAKQQQQ